MYVREQKLLAPAPECRSHSWHLRRFSDLPQMSYRFSTSSITHLPFLRRLFVRTFLQATIHGPTLSSLPLPRPYVLRTQSFVYSQLISSFSPNASNTHSEHGQANSVS